MILFVCRQVCGSILKPLGEQTGAMRQMAKGEIEIPGKARRDEFAAMASTLTCSKPMSAPGVRARPSASMNGPRPRETKASPVRSA